MADLYIERFLFCKKSKKDFLFCKKGYEPLNWENWEATIIPVEVLLYGKQEI